MIHKISIYTPQSLKSVSITRTNQLNEEIEPRRYIFSWYIYLQTGVHGNEVLQKTSQLILYWETMVVCSDNHKNINKLCGQIAKVLGAFAKLRKASTSFVMSGCLSVRPSISMEQLGSH
jgi:hypothetical protein